MKGNLTAELATLAEQKRALDLQRGAEKPKKQPPAKAVVVEEPKLQPPAPLSLWGRLLRFFRSLS